MRENDNQNPAALREIHMGIFCPSPRKLCHGSTIFPNKTTNNTGN